MIRDLSKAHPADASMIATLQRTLREIALVRWISSVSFGMTVLALILLYASVGSAIPQLRGVIEMTEMQVFKHWLFGALIALFCVSLTLATIVRVRWNVANLGVLTVHTGLLLLCTSAWWYFASKIEGDTILLAPRITLLQSGGAPLPSGSLAAREGETWTRTMPALGGRVEVSVDKVVADDLAASVAVVTARVGDGPPQTLTLKANEESIAISDRLRVRLVTSPPVSQFYDREIAALYYRADNETSAHVVPLEALPLFRERFLPGGLPILDRAERKVESKRTTPVANIGPLSIPTGWLEHWRLPIPIAAPDLPFDVEITGYLPYIANMVSSYVPGGAEPNPAAQVRLRMDDQSRTVWLLAGDPVQSHQRILAPFEFRWVADAAERDALLTPLAGSNELVVEIKDPPLCRTYAVVAGQTIEVDGTPYRLQVKQLSPDWPLMTPGFEGASSPVAIVDVTNGEKSYSRTVVQRFPHLSQDITEAGVRLRDGPYDDNIVMRYRDAERGWFMLVAGENVDPVFAAFELDGQVRTHPVRVGAPTPFHFAGMHLEITLADLLTHAQESAQPVVEPLERRRPSFGRPADSAIRLHFRGRGELAGWEASRWCVFSTYPNLEARPIEIRPPGSPRSYEFKYSRLTHDLGAELALKSLNVDLFPGGHSVERWQSEYFVREPGEEVRAAISETNRTSTVGRWTLFQSGAAKDHWTFTILGVGNRNGIMPQLLGCTLITLGCLYAFYVKPILRRRQTAAARARSGDSGVPERPAERFEQPVEVGR